MHKIFAGALSAPLLVIGTSGIALADNVGGLFGALFGGPTFAPITNERYSAECSGCHVAFPPELLPADAWGRVIDSLKDHFGDNASLDPAATKELRGYLTANAEKGNSTKGPHAVAAKTPTSDNPPRITDTTYFHGRHNENLRPLRQRKLEDRELRQLSGMSPRRRGRYLQRGKGHHSQDG